MYIFANLFAHVIPDLIRDLMKQAFLKIPGQARNDVLCFYKKS